MKKLLAMYICVSALVYGFNAKASGLDMPPLDNSHTQFSLVPESVFDNSSSFQMARTYFMPDYQRNLVGRVNDGGKDTNNKTCSAYGFVGNCTAPAVGKGIKHPIAGLTCYEKCECPSDYNQSKCPEGTKCEECNGKWKLGGCLEGYEKNEDGVCMAKGCLSYGGYDVCPAGYGVTENFLTPAGNHCVKCSKCVAGTYSKGTGPCVACACGTYSSQAGASSCTACASGSYQTATGQTSCKTVAHADGWTISADKCSITKKSCAAGYTAGVTTCSKGAYSSGGYSGDEVCGKCTLNDTCPAGQIDTDTYWCPVPVMDCSMLGYTKTVAACSGKQIVKCPFDETKIACFANE